MLPVIASTLLGAAAQSMRTVSVNEAEAPGASVGVLQLAVPVPPGAGLVQVQPAGAASDWNVVLAGIGIEATASVAVSGPPFVTTKTYAADVHGLTGLLGPDTVMPRSTELRAS